MNIFSLRFISGYYISTIISYFLIQVPFVPRIIGEFKKFILATMISLKMTNVANTFTQWATMFIVLLLFTVAIQYFLIRRLEIHSNKDYNIVGVIEKIFVFLLFVGHQIFLNNQVIASAMPVDVFPSWMIVFLGGADASRIATTTAELTSLSIVPFVWYAMPLAYLFYRGVVKSA
jgi:hypothetical protein